MGALDTMVPDKPVPKQHRAFQNSPIPAVEQYCHLVTIFTTACKQFDKFILVSQRNSRKYSYSEISNPKNYHLIMKERLGRGCLPY